MPGLRSSCRLRRSQDFHHRPLGFVVPTQSIGPITCSPHLESPNQVDGCQRCMLTKMATTSMMNCTRSAPQLSGTKATPIHNRHCQRTTSRSGQLKFMPEYRHELVDLSELNGRICLSFLSARLRSCVLISAALSCMPSSSPVLLPPSLCLSTPLQPAFGSFLCTLVSPSP